MKKLFGIALGFAMLAGLGACAHDTTGYHYTPAPPANYVK